MEVSIDLSKDPISEGYADIDTIQRHKQASHYLSGTGMGYGIRDAKEMLRGKASDPNDQGYARDGARPMMIIMTDGQTNKGPSGWSLPDGFKWSKWTDYDGDGYANY